MIEGARDSAAQSDPTLARTARAAFRVQRAQVTVGSGLRNAIGVGLPLTLGVATGNVAAGVSLAGGALLAAFADTGGPATSRAAMMLAGAGAGALSSWVGMTTGGGELATIAVTAIWGFVGALLIALGRAGTIGLLSTVGLIVVADYPTSAGQALHHAAFALAGGAFQASLALVFAPGPDRAPRRAVAQACRALGADVGQPRTSAFAAAVREAQAIVGRSADAEPAPPLMRELRGALDELDRLYIELSGIAVLRERLAGDEPALAQLERVDAGTAAVLLACADALEQRRALQAVDPARAQLSTAGHRLLEAGAARPRTGSRSPSSSSSSPTSARPSRAGCSATPAPRSGSSWRPWSRGSSRRGPTRWRCWSSSSPGRRSRSIAATTPPSAPRSSRSSCSSCPSGGSPRGTPRSTASSTR
jgi:hypothetical protein